MSKYSNDDYNRPLNERDKDVIRNWISFIFGIPFCLIWMIPLIILISLLSRH